MVERIDQTLKEKLSKWIIETDCSWMDLLPAALLKLRVTLHSMVILLMKLSMGAPPIVRQVSANMPQARGWDFTADGTTV